MIRRTDERLIVENPHGGVGSIGIYKLLTSDDTMDKVSLFAKVIINPQTTIGYHQHIGEAETYYVLKGEGFFINSQKERIPVKPGDVCSIEVGQSHGMENPHDNEMEIMALVYPEK
ncbi:cupin domain-containing protein [Alteribacter populi]|uniref:cupin domain-containing protein n=1 Tax=Alteribacter populi TaxID=2011011 RepID=UPI000BBB018A|nr:cupin domain-containing protein [Alteribacter populi]